MDRRPLARPGLVALTLLALVAACAGPRPVAPRPGWPAFGPEPPAPSAPWLLDDEEEDEEAPGPVGIGWSILMYIPNRVLDALDMVRARLRLGPGFAAGARATDLADVFIGTYATVYVGLPGPRGRKFPRLPAGLESKSGAEVSLADVTLEAGMGPDYGTTEFGAGFQLFLIGVDVGVDPGEILDFVLGFFTIDIKDDDF